MKRVDERSHISYHEFYECSGNVKDGHGVPDHSRSFLMAFLKLHNGSTSSRVTRDIYRSS